MELLYLSPCVPNPPDKGEKIRAYHTVRRLADLGHRVHVVCFARGEREAEQAQAMEGWCASVHSSPLRHAPALARAGLRFLAGGCLNTSYYCGGKIGSRVAELLRKFPIQATITFTAAMAPHAPEQLPAFLDMADVDSEKWFSYAKMRRPSYPYALEGRRLRQVEQRYGRRARHVWLITAQELALYRSFASPVPASVMENGVDAAYFDPGLTPEDPDLAHRRFLVFTGTMDYFPNEDAAQWFAREVLPGIRAHDPSIEFFVVGRNPSSALRQLASQAGVRVTGAVADIRPYLRYAKAFVGPLRLARGIQNKVLEALAMGLPALVSTPVHSTFGGESPLGVVHCAGPDDYLAQLLRNDAPERQAIRRATMSRFSWESALRPLEEQLGTLG